MSVSGAVIHPDGRVLAVQRADNGHWEPPGGVLELDETIEDGLRREIREETGIAVDIEALTGVYKNLKRGVVALVFRCRPASDEPPALSTETVSVAWLTSAEVRARMAPAYAIRLLDALEPGPPRIRAHDGHDLRP